MVPLRVSYICKSDAGMIWLVIAYHSLRTGGISINARSVFSALMIANTSTRTCIKSSNPRDGPRKFDCGFGLIMNEGGSQPEELIDDSQDNSKENNAYKSATLSSFG